jgi:hypothetical protein
MAAVGQCINIFGDQDVSGIGVQDSQNFLIEGSYFDIYLDGASVIFLYCCAS